MIQSIIKTYFSQKYLAEILLSLSIVVLGFSYIHLGGNNTSPNSGDKVVFLLDVSRSMNTQDIEDGSRLRAAKKHMFSELQKLNGYQYALSIFAGEGQRSLPFMQDASLFGTILSGISSQNILEQGTDYNAGLTQALKNFGENKGGIIYVYSDGHDESIELDNDLAEQIEDLQIDVKVIGVGSSRGAYIPGVTYRGQRVLSRLEKGSLRDLASDLGGKYYDINDRIFSRGVQSSGIGSSFLFYVFVICWFMFLYFFYKRSYV